jgi:hypothetical protein
LVLAKVPVPSNLSEAVRVVVGRLQSAPVKAGPRDVLVAPCISVARASAFSELDGRKIVSSQEWYMTRALQSIDFAIDEKGVTLFSFSLTGFGKCLTPPAARVMILRPPFLLLMKRRDSRESYFACWIANHDLLKLR